MRTLSSRRGQAGKFVLCPLADLLLDGARQAMRGSVVDMECVQGTGPGKVGTGKLFFVLPYYGGPELGC